MIREVAVVMVLQATVLALLVAAYNRFAQTTRLVRQFGTSSTDWGADIAVDGSGNVYVTGGTKGRLDGNPSAGGADIFVVKYSGTGRRQWVRQFGTGSRDAGNGIAVDGSGNVYVTGETLGMLDGNLWGRWGVFVVKYSGTGRRQRSFSAVLTSCTADTSF